MLMAVDEIGGRASVGFEASSWRRISSRISRRGRAPRQASGTMEFIAGKTPSGANSGIFPQRAAEGKVEMQAEVGVGREIAEGARRLGPVGLRGHGRGRGQPAGGERFENSPCHGGRQGEIIGAKRERSFC